MRDLNARQTLVLNALKAHTQHEELYRYGEGTSTRFLSFLTDLSVEQLGKTLRQLNEKGFADSVPRRPVWRRDSRTIWRALLSEEERKQPSTDFMPDYHTLRSWGGSWGSSSHE